MLADNAGLSLIGMVVVIVIVLGLAYWVTRWVAGGKKFHLPGRSGKDDRLRVLAQIPIGKDQRIVIVQTGQRYFVLGATAQSISTVAELTEEEAAAWLQPPEDPDKPQPPSFKESLLEVLQQRKQR